MKVNKERDDVQMRLLYTEVPLNRQLMTRRILDMATLVSALSPLHMEAMYRYIDNLHNHPFDCPRTPLANNGGNALLPSLVFDDEPYSPTAARQLHLLYENEDVQM